MNRRVLALLAAVVIITSIFGFVAIAEAARGQKEQISPSDTESKVAAKLWKSPRTPWGQPDLQGIWDYRTITPLERPSALSGKQFLTDEEAATYEREENRRQNRDLIDDIRHFVSSNNGSAKPPTLNLNLTSRLHLIAILDYFAYPGSHPQKH